MTQYICPKCKNDLEKKENGLYCYHCHINYPIKSSVYSFTEKDEYWGEFSEEKIDILLDKMRSGNYEKAREYIDQLGRTNFIFGKGRSDFIYYFDLDKEAVGLDTGCGLGVHSFNLAAHVKQVYGFDLSLKRVEFCNLRKKYQKVDNVEFLHSDFKHLPFKDNFFDFIMMNGVVEWLGEINEHKNPRDDQIKVLKKIHSLLKDKGQLYIGIENRIAFSYFKFGRDHNRLRFTSLMPRFLADLITKLIKKHPYRTYTYTRRGYEKLMRDSGFDLNKIEFYLAHPGYNLPQYIIPFDDLETMHFILKNMTKNYGIKGKIVRYLAQYKLFLRIVRHFFYSYLIYARK